MVAQEITDTVKGALHLNNLRAVPYQGIFLQAVGVALKMRPNCFISPIFKKTAVVECLNVPFVCGILLAALHPVGPVPGHRVWVAARDCTLWRLFTFLGVIPLVKLSVDDSAAGTVNFDGCGALAI